MIGKVTRGSDLGGLLRYLFGPGRANEHTRPHLVASWRGDDPDALADLEPDQSRGRPDVADLTARMALPLQLQPDVDRPVWQCSMRTAPGDRVLTDAEWAEVARDVVHRAGFAPHGDEAACRWVAVRHADDHIHIAVVLARMDGQPVNTFLDWPKVHAASRAAEHRLGLQTVPAPSRASRTAGRSPTRAEIEKTHRTTSGRNARAMRGRASQVETPRRWLTRQVRAAAAGASSREDFTDQLTVRGVLVTWRQSQLVPGQVTGYAVGRPGDVDGAGGRSGSAGPSSPATCPGSGSRPDGPRLARSPRPSRADTTRAGPGVRRPRSVSRPVPGAVGWPRPGLPDSPRRQRRNRTTPPGSPPTSPG